MIFDPPGRLDSAAYVDGERFHRLYRFHHIFRIDAARQNEFKLFSGFRRQPPVASRKPVLLCRQSM